MTKATHTTQRISAACRVIERAESAPSLAVLARDAGLSTFHFHRQFKAATGVTPREYASAWRARRVREALHEGDGVTAAIVNAGYGSGSRFYENANKLLGMTPTCFRKGGEGAAIRFGVGQCTLGAILVAASEKGICAILMGDDADVLVRDLQDRFQRANLMAGDRAFAKWMAKVIGFVEAPGVGLDLPLDIRGTAFQQRVWRALTAIPLGKTVSYTELARRIGAPKSVRAVASACAANKIAVAIPCHRVVRTDGSLSGYRWGVERKQTLLQRERE